MVAMINVQGGVVPAGGANPGSAELGGGGLSGLFGNNPDLLGGALGAGAGLLAGALGGKPDVPYSPQLQGVAGTAGSEGGSLFSTGQGLLSGLQTGTLPPGAEQSVQNQLKQAQDQIKARYAGLGQTGSTMEQDALSNLQNQTSAMRFQIAQQMAQTGLQATGQSLTALGIEEKSYGDLMQAQMKSDSSMNSTISSFASSLGSLAAKAAPALLA